MKKYLLLLVLGILLFGCLNQENKPVYPKEEICEKPCNTQVTILFQDNEGRIVRNITYYTIPELYDTLCRYVSSPWTWRSKPKCFAGSSLTIIAENNTGYLEQEKCVSLGDTPNYLIILNLINTGNGTLDVTAIVDGSNEGLVKTNNSGFENIEYTDSKDNSFTIVYTLTNYGKNTLHDIVLDWEYDIYNELEGNEFISVTSHYVSGKHFNLKQDLLPYITSQQHIKLGNLSSHESGTFAINYVINTKSIYKTEILHQYFGKFSNYRRDTSKIQKNTVDWKITLKANKPEEETKSKINVDTKFKINGEEIDTSFEFTLNSSNGFCLIDYIERVNKSRCFELKINETHKEMVCVDYYVSLTHSCDGTVRHLGTFPDPYIVGFNFTIIENPIQIIIPNSTEEET